MSYPQYQQPPPAPTTQYSKNPAIAAVLNFLFPGLGYWYVGIKKVFGLDSIIFLVIYLAASFIISWIIPFTWIIFLALDVIFAIDVYKRAQGQPGFNFISTEPPYITPYTTYPQQPAYQQPTAPTQATTPTCPVCGTPLVYVQEYNRWYCPKCQKYY